jgi:hypothetical protein
LLILLKIYYIIYIENEKEKKSMLTKKEIIDYIIDGRFEQDKRDLNLKLRGSSNQRIWHKVNSKTQEWKDITEQIDKNS